jgi:hypothetical protein
MRPVNLIPEELRPRVPGEGDVRVAYGVLGALALILVMVLVSISYSNKLATITDETAAIQAEADSHQASASSIVVTPDTVAGEVANRTLLVGGLAETRFPWGTALYDLSRSLPEDVTLDTITAASTGTGGTDAKGNAISGASLALAGCTSGWVGYSRFMTWLKTMPGVANVVSSQSAIGASSTGGDATGVNRTKNCGPAPLTFALSVYYDPLVVDFRGLPKPEGGSAAGPSGSTGASGAAATGTPAAATTPSTEPAS